MRASVAFSASFHARWSDSHGLKGCGSRLTARRFKNTTCLQPLRSGRVVAARGTRLGGSLRGGGASIDFSAASHARWSDLDALNCCGSRLAARWFENTTRLQPLRSGRAVVVRARRVGGSLRHGERTIAISAPFHARWSDSYGLKGCSSISERRWFDAQSDLYGARGGGGVVVWGRWVSRLRMCGSDERWRAHGSRAKHCLLGRPVLRCSKPAVKELGRRVSIGVGESQAPAHEVV